MNWNKSRLAVLLLTCAWVLQAQNAPDPSFAGKPIDYWMEGLRSSPPTNAPALVDSLRACGQIGWPAMAHLLKQPWTNANGFLDTARPARLNAIVSLFSDADKKKVRRSLWTWIKSSDPQIQATAIALRPSNPPYMLALKISRLRESSDHRVQLAFSFKTRQPLEAGWEPGYQMRVSPETPRAVVEALQTMLASQP